MQFLFTNVQTTGKIIGKNIVICKKFFCASNARYIKRNKILELILEDVSLKN